MKLRQPNDRNLDKKDYLYQPRLFRKEALASQKNSGRTCAVFMAGIVTGALLMLAALLMCPETVTALLRMVVQVIHSAGEQLW
ncbi:hypothetical protein [Klebsiella michiganensis]|uniref:hypothetical protein n=1 Tax=Klebsiella michiganensis TaxID=1134687 RepID=UPI003D966AB8